MALAINLLHLTLPKGPFRGFYYYAVKLFFTNSPEAAGTRLSVDLWTFSSPFFGFPSASCGRKAHARLASS